MARTSYALNVSLDEAWSITVRTDDLKALKEAARQAEAFLKGLGDGELVDVTEEVFPTKVPVCEVHGIPMVLQKGRFGRFFSCHQRNADGSFCDYKPA